MDANVLASRTLRDWLFLVQQDSPGLYTTHSSLDVVAEAVRVQRRRHPKADGSLTSRFQTQLRESLNEVLEDFPGDVEFSGSDVGDHHVHAAALACHADTVLTENHRDFGDRDLLDYEVMSSDSFFILVADSAPQAIRNVVLTQLEYWQSRQSSKRLDVALQDAGCPVFAELVSQLIKDPVHEHHHGSKNRA